VRKKIEEIRKGIAGHFYTLGELLGEIKDGGFHVQWGFQNFGLWLKQSGLDLSESAGYYLIKIVHTTKELGIPREQVEQIKLSKLREVCRLAPKTHGKQIKRLLDACTPDKDGNEMSLEDVRLAVQKVEGGAELDDKDTKIDLFVFLTVKVTTTAKQVIEDAFELARCKHGDSIDAEGNPVDISNGKCLELIAADFLAGADEVEQEDEIMQVEQKLLPAVSGAVDEPVGPEYVPTPIPEDTFTDAEVVKSDELILPSDEEVVVENHVSPVEEAPLEAPVVENPTGTKGRLVSDLIIPSDVDRVVSASKQHMADAATRVESNRILDIDVKAVEQRIAADLAAKNNDVDPMLEDVRAEIAAEEFAEASDAVIALALVRRHRIGTARALNLIKAVRGAK
jgi:hypothetical protein